MSEETCPTCGKEGLTFTVGIVQCPACDYTRILSPCTGCSQVLTCRVDCAEERRWKARQKGDPQNVQIQTP